MIEYIRGTDHEIIMVKCDASKFTPRKLTPEEIQQRNKEREEYIARLRGPRRPDPETPPTNG